MNRPPFSIDSLWPRAHCSGGGKKVVMLKRAQAVKKKNEDLFFEKK